MSINLKKIKVAHLVGIGGAGMSAVARILHKKKIQVSGSNLEENQVTKQLAAEGITIFIGHDKLNLPAKCDILIYSSAVPEKNPERTAGAKMGVDEYEYHDFIGHLTEEAENIVICGTNGKTTTTAMAAELISKGKRKPTAIVGSNIISWKSNVLNGADDFYVIEGDEFARGILHLQPKGIILTNLEHDHFDTYPHFSDYIHTFQDFINRLPDDGIFVYNADDEVIAHQIEKPACKTLTFGIHKNADLMIKNHKVAHGRQIFKMVYKGQELKDYNIRLPGFYNIYNALGAALMALELSSSANDIKDVLAVFSGASRRFEKVGTIKGVDVISDYAHHPTALKELALAVKQFYPERKIVLWYQPHQKNRTRNLLLEYSQVIEQLPVDYIVLNEIYDVAGRSDEVPTSSKDILKKVKRKDIVYAQTLEEGYKLVSKKINKGDLLVIAGAGDIDDYVRSKIEK